MEGTEANGSAIPRYRVDISRGKGRTVNVATRRVFFKKLKPGRYSIRIAARKSVGWSAYSKRVRVRIA